MTARQGQIPTIAWVAVCVLAAGVGFFIGERQKSALTPDSQTTRAVSADTIALNNHTISDVVSRASRSVVSISLEPAREENDSEHVVPGIVPYSRIRVAGAGIVIRPDGYVVTSNHVLGVGKKVLVTLKDHRKFIAKIVGRDWFSDVAVLKIEATDLPAAQLGDSASLHPGDWAVAIGSPMQLDQSVSLGIVSAIGRTVSDIAIPGTDLIQTDAAMNPGNSGGPLLDIKGQVIGMNTAVHREAQNISFAVPIEIVKEVSDALIANGKLARGYLGLFMGNARDNAPPPDDTQDGVYIILVSKDSPAEQAGLHAGDIIKFVNGKQVHDAGDVRRIVMPMKPGESVDLRILSRGRLQNVTFALGETPNVFKTTASKP